MRSSQHKDLNQGDLLRLLPSRGLQTSSWASNSNRLDHSSSGWSQSSPGDWICTACHFSNYQWRTSCFRCSAPTPGRVVENGILRSVKDEGPHICLRIHPSLGEPCGTKFARLVDLQRHEDLIHGGRLQTGDETVRELKDVKHNGYQSYPPSRPLESQHLTLPPGHALSTSRWAPRNYTGRPKKANANEVWIKTVPAAQPSSNSHQSKTSTQVSQTPDLGLPYEVQHCILTIIQRILEEGCYDFATRWIPNVLNDNNWSCSEAVELSTWRKTLPISLPPHALNPIKNYTLEAALADAVRIRNSATHRHLENNHELRRMTLQARDLMSMFSDLSRERKLSRLWTELNEWETGSVINEQAARNRLQEALQEIGERPMDEMDWTPNSVSLQEISSSEEASSQLQETHAQDMYLDEMEID